jgi:hypothetical protein
VAKGWAEPWTCADAAELQRRADDTDRLQREEYAGPGRRPRRQVFRAPAHSGWPYQPEAEGGLWDLERVKEHWARYVVRRKVDPLGKVSPYNRPRPGGQAWIGKVVNIGFDADEGCWVATADKDLELRQTAAPEVSREAVMGLQRCYGIASRPAPAVDPLGRAADARPPRRRRREA